MQEENKQTNNEATTKKHPSEQGAKIAPIRQSVALLWACKYCRTFHATRHLNETVQANWTGGSKKAPLRCTCSSCKKRNRLRSEDNDLVWAEVPWRKIGQRKALMAVAEAMNILGADSDHLPKRSAAYTEWNRLIGYKGKKIVPQPFKRWMKRGDA